MIKTGIISEAYFQWEDYERGLEKIKAHGYDCVDYNFMSPALPIYSLSEKDYEASLRKIGDFAKKIGVEIFQMHGLWSNETAVANTPKKRAENIAWFKKQLRGAAFLQCKNMVIHPCMPCGWWGESKDHDEILGFQLDELSALIPTAEEYGVTICVENMPIGIATTSFIKEIVKKANHRQVKACFDTGHANMQREDMLKSVRLLGDDLRVLHVHDNNGRDDAHAIPFQYDLDWDNFIKGLREIKFQGCMSLETRVRLKTPEPMRTEMQKSLSKIARFLATQVGE